MFGSCRLWCGNHWQPVSCDPQQHISSVSSDQVVEGTVHVDRACASCCCSLRDTKDLLDAVTSLQLHSTHTCSDCSDRNVLQQYSRCLECEGKLVELFDNTMTITAKEDLLHSLR